MAPWTASNDPARTNRKVEKILRIMQSVLEKCPPSLTVNADRENDRRLITITIPPTARQMASLIN
jgi:hypothetical protein